MTKEYISYSIVGILIGLFIGFTVANWTWSGPAGPQQASAGADGQASVNSSTPSAELPAGHPPVEPGQTVPAPPLPAGSETASASMPTAPAGESTELPSLDPLPPGNREERTEQKYKNIQMLKGLPAERLMSVMFAFKAALGVDCTHCHIKDQWEKDDRPAKQIARKMITLTRDANAKLGGVGRVTCFTCHRGQVRPPS